MTPSLRVRATALTATALVMLAGAGTPAQALPAAACATTTSLTLLNFNDFHGRLSTSSPNTVAWAGQIEEQRAAAGEANSLLLSAGDSVGATLFSSFSQNDEPTLELLKALDVEASAAGNHEFDQGWNDLKTRIIPGVDFPYLSANVVDSAGNPVMPAYTVIERAGLRVGVVGAITKELPGLVSPSGLAGLTVTDPVAAVNKTIAALKDGNTANGEADVIVVEYHDGALYGSSTSTLAEQVASSPAFADLVNGTDARAQVIFNGHTHQVYAWAGPVAGGTRPIVQAGSYASHVARVALTLDATSGATCSYQTTVLEASKTPAATLIATYPRVAAVSKIVTDAIAQSKVIGAQIVGTATAPITRALTKNPDGTVADDRLRESTMSNLVAKMFADVLGNGDPEFIGLQNPGGTRADFDAGDITYAEAAAVLPFANTLKTTQLTGAQVKTVLEQQWQVNKDGSPYTGSRKYLRLGISPNVAYTYNAANPWGSRITGIYINGKPIDPKKLYTVGSGSFLIDGGDQFWEVAKGVNTKDTGRADLEAFVGWTKASGTVSPDYRMRGVSVDTWPAKLVKGRTYQVTGIGVPKDALALDTLDLKTNGVVNTTLTASLRVAGRHWKTVGTAQVVAGQVAAISIKVPTSVYPRGTVLRLTAGPSQTPIYLKVVVSKARPRS